MTAAAADFAALIEPVATRLLGEPNRKLSSKTELRFGGRGSLSVDLGTGVFFDHESGEGGGTLDLIAREKGLDKAGCVQWLVEERLLSNGEDRAHKPRIVATYRYEGEGGELLFEVVRFEPKDLRQRRLDPAKRGEWLWSTRGVRQVPYRLPELIEALSLGHLVVVEGERDADRLLAIGVPATRNAGGAGKWKPELSEVFVGADVVIIPDHDPQKKHPKTGQPMVHADGRPMLPGQDHAQAVALALNGVARRVRVLDLAESWPAMPLKGAVSDWIDAGGTAEALYALVDRLPDWSPAKLAAKAEPPADVTPVTLGQAITTFNTWLVLKDMGPIYAVLGALAANNLPGDAVWLGIIALPLSAKSEILNALIQAPRVEAAATLSMAALLSGTPKHQTGAGAKGGLLRKIGDFGVLVLKDFGSILSMRPDAKAELLAALREIYDGAWTRHVGVDGGRTLAWKGKLGLIFACTEAFDDHHTIITGLGDRFLLCRLAPASGKQQFKRAFDHTGATTKAMRAALAAAVAGLFAGCAKRIPRPLADDEREKLGDVIKLAVLLRAHVNRNAYSREIESIHGAEGPGRIGLCLERLLAGLDVIGLARDQALALVKSIAMDSCPPIRRAAFERLTDAPQSTRAIADMLKLPTTTARRALEDLAAQGLAVRERPPKKAADDGLPADDLLGDDSGQKAKGGADQKAKGGSDLWRIAADWGNSWDNDDNSSEEP